MARFRVNAFVQRGSVSIVCRAIPFQIKTVEELLLPPVISEIADEERGLILLTGTTGSGKSTTLASMIDHINSNYAKHIVTIEDPVEFLHRDKTSIINQREVGEDTASFARALRRVLRQDPDVILVGEMRDEETVRTALSAAETGHLVLSTHPHRRRGRVRQPHHRLLPAGRAAPGARDAGRHAQGASSPSGSCRRPTGMGRVATCEILRMTGRVTRHDHEPGGDREAARGRSPRAPTTACRPSTRRCSTTSQQGRVAMEDALKAATHPHDFKLLVSSDGMRSSSARRSSRRASASVAGRPAANGAQPSPSRRARRVTRSVILVRPRSSRRPSDGRAAVAVLERARIPTARRRSLIFAGELSDGARL